MGLWSGIKYALNDTLGTSSFKPLNKLVNDIVVANKVTHPNVVKRVVTGSWTSTYGGSYYASNGSVSLGGTSGKLALAYIYVTTKGSLPQGTLQASIFGYISGTTLLLGTHVGNLTTPFTISYQVIEYY